MNYQKLLCRVTSVALSWLFLAGCGRSAAVPFPTLEPGWKLYEKPEAGLAIALPPGWGQINLQDQAIEDFMETGLKSNPELAIFFDWRARDLVISGAKFFGFDLSGEFDPANFDECKCQQAAA